MLLPGYLPSGAISVQKGIKEEQERDKEKTEDESKVQNSEHEEERRGSRHRRTDRNSTSHIRGEKVSTILMSWLQSTAEQTPTAADSAEKGECVETK